MVIFFEMVMQLTYSFAVFSGIMLACFSMLIGQDIAFYIEKGITEKTSKIYDENQDKEQYEQI